MVNEIKRTQTIGTAATTTTTIMETTITTRTSIKK